MKSCSRRDDAVTSGVTRDNTRTTRAWKDNDLLPVGFPLPPPPFVARPSTLHPFLFGYMASEIAQCLAATLSADNNTRVAAELRLAKLSESSGSSSCAYQHIVTHLKLFRVRCVFRGGIGFGAAYCSSGCGRDSTPDKSNYLYTQVSVS